MKVTAPRRHPSGMEEFLELERIRTSYGNENKYIFVGQTGSDELATTAFVLELIGDNLEQHVQINETGEVYLKVDKIVAIPKETFSRFANLAGSNSQPYSTQAVATSFLASNQLNEGYEEMEIACRKCRFYYTPRPETTAWHKKEHVTFSDMLRAVRMAIWRENLISRKGKITPSMENISPEIMDWMDDIVKRVLQ